jgi:hypothetical protein
LEQYGFIFILQQGFPRSFSKSISSHGQNVFLSSYTSQHDDLCCIFGDDTAGIAKILNKMRELFSGGKDVLFLGVARA